MLKKPQWPLWKETYKSIRLQLQTVLLSAYGCCSSRNKFSSQCRVQCQKHQARLVFSISVNCVKLHEFFFFAQSSLTEGGFENSGASGNYSGFIYMASSCLRWLKGSNAILWGTSIPCSPCYSLQS